MFELMRPNLETSISRSEAGSKIKKETNEEQNGNNRKGIGIGIGIKDKKNSGRFAPPSVDEVREYCAERQNKVDPEAFVSFYDSNGWKVGRNAMKDWKAAVRTWEKREKPAQIRTRAGRFDFKEQRNYDMADLERRLLAKGGTA